MNKRLALVSVLLVLIATYVVFFSDFWKKQEIRIECTNLRFRSDKAPAGAKAFLLEHPCRIKSIMVARADDAATNKYPHALWHLVAPRPVRLDTFYYGEPIRGMAPSIPESKPEPLDPGEKYRLVVETSAHELGVVVFETSQAR